MNPSGLLDGLQALYQSKTLIHHGQADIALAS